MERFDRSAPSDARSWATPVPAGVALIGGGIALAAAAGASYTEPPAMVFIGIAAVGLFVAGVIALVRRPRLALSDGPRLTVRTLTRQFEMTPDDVVRVGVLTSRRLAGKSRQLVIDLPDDRLLVFGRWDLGAPPSAVVEEIVAAGFPG